MADYIPWADSQNTRLHQHAVEQIGHKALLLVPETLNPGFLQPGFLQEIPLSNDFNGRDILKIHEGDTSKWDITLLYKVDQRVCGLAPVNSDRWTKKEEEGEEFLENHMYEMKELRNKLCHSSHYLIMSGTQLFNYLKTLEILSMKVLNALIIIADERGCVFENERVEDFKKFVNDVLMDVQQYIVY